MDARLHSKNILLLLPPFEDPYGHLENFYGTTLTATHGSSTLPRVTGKFVYLCGDVSKANTYNNHLKSAARILVIKELSENYQGDNALIDDVALTHGELGQVPILIHNLGVFYRRFFSLESNYYAAIHADHTLQSLTES